MNTHEVIKVPTGTIHFWSNNKIKNMNTLNDVEQFHVLFNHPVLKQPTIPAKNRADLRVSLLQEELDEFKKAIEDKDIVAVADALCDLQYVLSGAVLEFGLKDKFPALFTEVQRSNMSKACTTIEEVEATINKYEPKEGPCHYFSKWLNPVLSLSNEQVFIVARNSDDKTLKSVNYSPADLKTIIES